MAQQSGTDTNANDPNNAAEQTRKQVGLVVVPSFSAFGENESSVYLTPLFRQAQQIEPPLSDLTLHLSLHNAVVLYGPVPPSEATYWSFTPYLFLKHGTTTPQFSSLFDSPNNFSLPRGVKRIAGIMSRNRSLVETLAQRYLRRGYFVMPVPVPSNQVGELDDLLLVFRATFLGGGP